MTIHHPRVVVADAVCCATLLIVAALTPEGQTPIMPLQLTAVFAALGVWVAWRGSRASVRTIGVLGGLLALFALHPLTGDVTGGAFELVGDVVALLGALLLFATVVHDRRIVQSRTQR